MATRPEGSKVKDALKMSLEAKGNSLSLDVNNRKGKQGEEEKE